MWAAGFRRLPVVEVRDPPLLGLFYPPQSDLDSLKSRFSEELKLLQRSPMASAPPPVARERFFSPGGACGMPWRPHPHPGRPMPGPAIASLRPLSRSSTLSLRRSEAEMRETATASFARSELAPPTMGDGGRPALSIGIRPSQGQSAAASCNGRRPRGESPYPTAAVIHRFTPAPMIVMPASFGAEAAGLGKL